MFRIIPIPKKVKITNNVVFLDQDINTIDEHFDQNIITNTLKKDLPHIGGLSFIYDATLENEEYYFCVNNESVSIWASTTNGAYYAIKSLKQIAVYEYGAYTIPICEVSDKPDQEIRGVMLDISRNKVLNVSEIKNLIDLFSELKINHLELYIEGLSYYYPSYKKYYTNKNYITKDDIVELVDYAKEHMIDLVPNQNGFGHMSDWLMIDDFKELREVEGLFKMWGSYKPSSTLDATNPKSEEFVASLYDELLPYFKSKYFNMDLDEPFELGHGKSKELVDKTSKEKVFLDYFERLATHVYKRGLTPMIWADVIVNHQDAVSKVKDDVVLIDWGYNLDYPFEKHAQMFERFNKKFVLASGTSTWANITGRLDDMFETVRKTNLSSLNHGGLGTLITDWGDFGHLQYLPFSYPGFVYQAMCSWNYHEAHLYDLKKYLTKLYGTIEMVELIFNLARYTSYEGEYRSYGSKLFAPIVGADKATYEENKVEYFISHMKYNLLTEYQADALAEMLKNTSKQLEKLKDLTPPIIYEEVKNSVYLLRTLLNLNQDLSNVILNQCLVKFKFISDIQKYLNTHKKLWAQRNNKAGYLLSASKIEVLVEILKTLEKEA